MKETQTKVQTITRLALKAVAVGMAVASMVLGYLGVVNLETQVNLIALGLFALSVAALQIKD